METKSILFGRIQDAKNAKYKKIGSWAFHGFAMAMLCLSLSSCQSFSRHNSTATSENKVAIGTQGARTAETKEAASNPRIPGPPQSTNPVEIDEPKATESLKVGIILGPGGLRAFAHIGVLQELQRAKVPIHALVGIEWGSLVGSIYASKAQLYDVEWQMQKLKEEDYQKRSLLGAGPRVSEVITMDSYLKTVFGATKTEDFKVPFACPSLNVSRQQTFMMNRGPVSTMLSFCLASPPLFKPHLSTVAALTPIQAAVQFLKSKGANYFIYVSLIDAQNFPSFESSEESAWVYWSAAQQTIGSQMSLVHRVIQVPLGSVSISDFKQKRDSIFKGQEVGRKAAEDIALQFGL